MEKRSLSALLLISAMVLTVVPLSPLSVAYIQCPPGSTTWSGTAKLQQGSSPGVVIFIRTENNFLPGASATVNVPSSGSWSVTLPSTCPVNVGYYWQSDTNGPLLKQVNGYQNGGTVTLNVWLQPITVDLMYEYPDTANTAIQVSASQSASLTVSIQASVNGGIDLGFLSGSVGGKVASSMTWAAQQIFQSPQLTSPYEVFWNYGTAVKVQDSNGNSAVYVQPAQIATLSTTSIGSDPVSMSSSTTSVTVARCTSGNCGPQAEGFGISTTITASAEFDAKFNAFGTGFTLAVSFSGSGTNVFETTALLTNPSATQEACFDLYFTGPGLPVGLDVHAWFKGYYPAGTKCTAP